MSENLTQAINDMRTMRESYNQLGAAAEAYNVGKTELAANITAKGVEASASETLPELAEKVSAIQQETIEIDGGEMFETQLYGAPTNVENVGGVYVQTGGALWNLYDVMAQLLSDGRFVQYGGIMLAEYFKGYDTIELMNVGAGGAYFTCDGDFYTTDKTGENAHVWHDNENGMMNRWVAYLFAAESTNYTIPSESLCPRSIHIGRKVGTISCASAGRIREIVVTDGNELYGTAFDSTQVWQQEVTLKNITNQQAGYLFNQNSNLVSLYLDKIKISKNIFYYGSPNLASIYINDVEFGESSLFPTTVLDYNNTGQLQNFLGVKYLYIKDGILWPSRLLRAGVFSTIVATESFILDGIKTLKCPIFGHKAEYLMYRKLILNSIEHYDTYLAESADGNRLYLNNLTEIQSKNSDNFLFDSMVMYGTSVNLIDIWLGEVNSNLSLSWWNPTNVIADTTKLAQLNANIRNHIAANIADGDNTLTFTISTNLYNNLEQATLDAFAAKHWLVAGA